MTAQSIVSVQNLNHFFGENALRKQVLFDIDLEIRPKEFVILTGPSGSGKSTLLSLIGCLRSVQTGSLKVLGQELNGANNGRLINVRRHFGYITQSSNLLHFLTAQQNVQMSLELHPRLSGQDRRSKAKAILEAVGLEDRIAYYPDNLSGGQRQRVAIASALVTNPKLMLADEPTAALDRKSGRNVVALMHRLAKEQGSAVLMVTHDNRILDLADRIINVEDGKLGLAVSQELSIALPGFNASLLEKSDTKPTVLTYEDEEIIVRQGDSATKFYVILEGEVEIIQETPNQPDKLLRRMGRGEYFGEIGLLQGGKRTATVRVAKDSEVKVMVIEEELFRLLIADSDLTNTDVARRLHQRIMTSHLAIALPNLSTARIAEVLAEVEVVRYGPNSNIVQQGQPADRFYLISKGQVEMINHQDEVEVTNYQGDESDITRRTMQSGEYFGETELINRQSYDFTIRARPDTSVEVMVLDRKTFCSLIYESNASQDEVAAVLRNRLMGHADPTPESSSLNQQPPVSVL